MKGLTAFGSTATAVLAAALQVSAQPTPITSADPDFQDTAASTLRLNVGSSTALTGTFNLETDTGSITIGSGWSDAGQTYTDYTGFNPSTETAVSGTISFWIKTTTGDIASYSVSLTDPSQGSFIGPYNGRVQYDFGSGSLTGAAIVDLNTDGELSYSIQNTGHGSGYTDFTVSDLVLQVDTEPGDPPSAPDSCSTALLFGGALLGIGFVKRKLA